MSKPRLQEHQLKTLREELAKPEYAEMSDDDAYLTVSRGLVARRLARTNYVDAEELALIDPEDEDAPKKRAELMNRPGFPTKVRRADFDIVRGTD